MAGIIARGKAQHNVELAPLQHGEQFGGARDARIDLGLWMQFGKLRSRPESSVSAKSCTMPMRAGLQNGPLSPSSPLHHAGSTLCAHSPASVRPPGQDQAAAIAVEQALLQQFLQPFDL
jgi:hypothetical protein